MKALFVAWQDSKTRKWAPIGRLTREDDLYKFVYTRGAEEMPESHRFGRMRDLHKVYESEELFPMFTSRVLAKNRPEYGDYLQWLGLSKARYDVLEELARTGGLRATDSLELFPCPEPTVWKNYEVYFFCRGLRHLREENQELALQMQAGERLYLMQDLQNPQDEKALLMRTDDPITIVGYAPRYYSAEFTQLIQSTDLNQVRVTIEQVNPEAPVQYQLLCRLVSPWPANFSPCTNKEFEALA